MKRAWIEHIAVLGAYALLGLLFSFPLVLHLGDAVPGVPGDVWSYVWATGWARVSTLELGINPLRSDYVYYPLGGATQLLWATALPAFLSIPLQLVWGLIPAFNLLYIAATAFTGYGTYLLAKQVLSRIGAERGRLNGSLLSIASFVAGASFAFCALRLGYGLAFTNLFHTELIPFYLLFLLRSRRSWRNAVLAGLMLGLNAYIDFQIAAFLALFSGIWFLWELIGDWRRARGEGQEERAGAFARSGLLTRAAVVALIAGITVLPLAAMVGQDMAAEGGNYIRVYPLKYSASRSYDLLSYVLPNARSTLYQQLPVPRVAGVNAAVNVEGESQLSPDRQSFLGLAVLLLAALGALWRPRALSLWLVSGLVFALISLGPTLRVAGADTRVPLPYTLLHQLPIANHIRIPMRYGLMAFLPASLLAGAGVYSLSARFRSLVAVPALAGLVILAEAAVLPYPMQGFTLPEVYRKLATQPGDFSVLEIPSFNWRAAAATEVYQVFHGKRLLRAYTNRIAPDVADYFGLRQTPIVARSLRILEGAEEGALSEEDIARDREVAPPLFRFFDLRYAVLHRDWLEPEAATRLEEYLAGLGARRVWDDGPVSAYELPLASAPPSTVALDIADNASLMYLGRGWQTEPLADVQDERGRYVKGSKSELYTDAPGHELRLRAYSEKGGAVLEFDYDGLKAGALQLAQGWNDYHLTLPAAERPLKLNLLTFQHSPDEQNRIAIGRMEIR